MCSEGQEEQPEEAEQSGGRDGRRNAPMMKDKPTNMHYQQNLLSSETCRRSGLGGRIGKNGEKESSKNTGKER